MKTCLILDYNTLTSTVCSIQQLTYRGWHQVNRQEDWDEGEMVELKIVSSSGRGQAAVSLTPDISCWSQTHMHVFGSSHLEGSYAGDLQYLTAWISPRRYHLPDLFPPVESLHGGMGGDAWRPRRKIFLLLSFLRAVKILSHWGPVHFVINT